MFVSYSRRDGEFVRGLAADLESRGKSVWIDTQGIGDGEVFPDAIRRAIEQSDAFVFVITPESVASPYCETEVEYAQQLQKRVVPVPPPRRWPRSMSRAALASLAVERRYVRPEIDRSLDFVIEGGRHPVVEQAHHAIRSSPTIAIFAAEAARAPGRIWLLTGPNMAGKSTFLRQNALIVVLAQMGGFVPAKRASIGVVDRLFSRVGAADDLARGRSTFMVEMVETAAILNQAGERSLVILDEIGRGTATFDGLSIAWAAIEHLHETQPLPRAVRDAFPRADRARAPSCRGCTTPPCGSRNGRARWCSCTRSCRAPPTAPTASRWRSSPACRRA